jgi:hypothetical protein
MHLPGFVHSCKCLLKGYLLIVVGFPPGFVSLGEFLAALLNTLVLTPELIDGWRLIAHSFLIAVRPERR